MDDPPTSDAGPRGPQVLVSDRQQGPLDPDALIAVARKALAGEGVTNGELSISFVTPEEMADLHRRFVHEDGPTDVLSFPMGEDGLIGDVVVCPEEARKNNAEAPDSELRLLVAHGVLHLLGYDHEREDDRAKMWALQARYSGVQSA
jgi:probable rRNA maturation factor